MKCQACQQENNFKSLVCNHFDGYCGLSPDITLYVCQNCGTVRVKLDNE